MGPKFISLAEKRERQICLGTTDWAPLPAEGEDVDDEVDDARDDGPGPESQAEAAAVVGRETIVVMVRMGKVVTAVRHDDGL